MVRNATLQNEIDADGDGFTPEDCDDNNANESRSGRALYESCSATKVDDVATIYYRDADGDGFGDPEVDAASCEGLPDIRMPMTMILPGGLSVQ